MKFRNKIILLSAIFIFFATGANADSVGDKKNFYVNSEYDIDKRTSISAILVKSGAKANIYADEQWWNFISQSEAKKAISDLALEFDNRIYPRLTGVFGQEPNPGIDQDPKITILVQSMNSDVGGYFRTNDEYSKFLATDSNEREMIYVNSKHVLDQNFKSFVAHEFVHLITFNQKNLKYDKEEDTWLNEARAEYAPTLLGYNDNYDNSYLEKRVQYFSEKPNGSLVDVKDGKYSYSKISMFAHYLVDQYGIDILVDSLNSPGTGIGSINYALEKNGFKESFSKIFADWTIAVVINDCSYGENYCYLNKNLKNFYLSPAVNFLPLSGAATLTFSDSVKQWSGNWYKLIGGGGGTLKFYFKGDSKGFFKVPYVEKSKSGAYTINFLDVASAQKGEFNIQDFGKEVISLFVLPSLHGNGVANNNYYSLFWSASIIRPGNDANTDEISSLLAQIAELKKEIARLQQQGQNPGGYACGQFAKNLYFGMQNSNDVKCLQSFLKSQGADIYPEGYVTGNFGQMTKSAVIRFQEKYKAEILTPLGLQSGTGYAGASTRQKINQLLNAR